MQTQDGIEFARAVVEAFAARNDTAGISLDTPVAGVVYFQSVLVFDLLARVEALEKEVAALNAAKPRRRGGGG